MKIATVFGGSTPSEGDTAYLEARRLGEKLATAGWGVATGAYSGTMEAVSRGAMEAGGHTIGIGCERIETYRGAVRNQWVKEMRTYPTLRERAFELIRIGDALLALPGGVGTLSEIALSWSLLQTGEVDAKPLILIGPAWERMLAEFEAHAGGYYEERDLRLLSFAPTIDTAVAALVEGAKKREER